MDLRDLLGIEISLQTTTSLKWEQEPTSRKIYWGASPPPQQTLTPVKILKSALSDGALRLIGGCDILAHHQQNVLRDGLTEVHPSGGCLLLKPST
jgi:hypothetical protein